MTLLNVFAWQDWSVIALFGLLMIGIVVYVTKQKNESSGDYFLDGRNATWLAIGTSLFASNIGSEHLIGLAGSGAASGMAMAHWEIQGWMILILAWVFVPFYERSQVMTMPEFLERRYNSASRSILTGISIISYVMTKVAVTVYAGGLVFQQVFGIKEMWGIDFFWIAAIGLVIITAIYTILGGMKSVLYTSVLQTPILLLGSAIILFLGFKLRFNRTLPSDRIVHNLNWKITCAINKAEEVIIARKQVEMETDNSGKSYFYPPEDDEEPQEIKDMEEKFQKAVEMNKKIFGIPAFEHESNVRGFSQGDTWDMMIPARPLDITHTVESATVEDLFDQILNDPPKIPIKKDSSVLKAKVVSDSSR